MTLAILLACIPFALGVGLLWGFALGCLTPTASRRPSKRAARQKAWEKHWAANREAEDAAAATPSPAKTPPWAANREAEDAAAFAELSSARMAGDTFKQANE